MCAISASSLGSVRTAVYMLNCMHRISSTLTIYESDRAAELAKQTAPHVDALVQEQLSCLMKGSGLQEVITAMQSLEGEGDASVAVSPSEYPGLSEAKIIEATVVLDKFLAAAEYGLSGDSYLIVDGTIRSTIASKAIKVFVALYTRLYALVSSPSGGYSNGGAVMRRTPAQLVELMKL